MKRLGLAGTLALLAAIGCSKSSQAPEAGAAKGVGEGTFTITVQNGQSGNAALRIRGGRVYSPDLLIDCGIASDGTRREACSRDLALGTTVVLRAAASGMDTSVTPERPFLFLGWGGDCAGEGECTLAGNADRYVVANFGSERRSHPNYSSPAVHAPAWAAYASGAPGALDCTTCHGAKLQGQGIAVSCSGCHAWPLGAAGTLSWDVGTWDQASWAE